jgi:malonyl CoA-acyl carrier protein transacylase
VARKPPAASKTEQRPTSSLAEELRFLFVNTLDPRGRRWSLQSVVDEAARYGESLSRSYVAMLLKGKIGNPTVRKIQVLGMVFGVGSMGLIHPIEAGYQDEQETALQKMLKDIQQHTGVVEKALQNAKLQRAVLLLSGYQDETTLEQAARIIEEIGEMEKHFLDNHDKSGAR